MTFKVRYTAWLHDSSCRARPVIQRSIWGNVPRCRRSDSDNLVSESDPHRDNKAPKPMPSASDQVEFTLYRGENELEELVRLIDKDLSEPYSVFTYRYFLYNWPDLCVLARVHHKLVGAIVCRREKIGFGQDSYDENPAMMDESATVDVGMEPPLPTATVSSQAPPPAPAVRSDMEQPPPMAGPTVADLLSMPGTNDPANPVRWRGYIAMLAVDKKFRKQGIGSRLVEQAIDLMIKKGCQEIMLETEVCNTGAIRLYENLGFVRDERLVKYYLNGGDAFRLKLWLQ